MEPGHDAILELSICLTQKTQRGQLQTEHVLREVCFQRGEKGNWAVIQLREIILKPMVIHFITFCCKPQNKLSI